MIFKFSAGLMRNNPAMVGPIAITTVTKNIAGKCGEEIDRYIF